jgi:hypothetical protein
MIHKHIHTTHTTHSTQPSNDIDLCFPIRPWRFVYLVTRCIEPCFPIASKNVSVMRPRILLTTPCLFNSSITQCHKRFSRRIIEFHPTIRHDLFRTRNRTNYSNNQTNSSNSNHQFQSTNTRINFRTQSTNTNITRINLRTQSTNIDSLETQTMSFPWKCSNFSCPRSFQPCDNWYQNASPTPTTPTSLSVTWRGWWRTWMRTMSTVCLSLRNRLVTLVTILCLWVEHQHATLRDALRSPKAYTLMFFVLTLRVLWRTRPVVTVRS